MAEKEENKQVNLFESSLETDFSKPKTLDTSSLEKQIQKISTPTSSNVYDKLAALYRQETQGRSLRETTDLQRALLPAAELYRQREEEANERFAELVEQIPTFDDSTLYGEKTGGVGFESEIMGASNEIRNDLRLLSRLNPADPRYNELAQKVRQKQNNIIKYNDLNQKLLDIRNSEIDPSEISNVYNQAEKQAYRDILLGKSENISFKNGTLTYTYKNPDDESAEPIIVDLEKLDINPFEVSDDVRSVELEIRTAAEEFNGEMLDANGNPTLDYSKKIGMRLRSFKRTSGKQIKGLILDGNVLPGSNQYININTQPFIKILDDNGFTFEQLQKSEMLSEKVEINGVEKTVKQHFFDYYESYINQTVTKKQDNLQKLEDTEIKKILRNTAGFNSDFYKNVSRYFNFDVNQNTKDIVFIPKEDLQITEDAKTAFGLKENMLKKDESYTLPGIFNKEEFTKLFNEILKGQTLTGKDPIVFKGGTPVNLKEQPGPGRQEINAIDFIKILNNAGFKINTSEDVVRLKKILTQERLDDFNTARIMSTALKQAGYNINYGSVSEYFEKLEESIIL